jgi:hypothetical protein
MNGHAGPARKVPLSARPGHGPGVPSCSAPGPPPGLRSLVRRAAVSAPPSSPASRSSPGPVALAAACGEAPWAERARRAKLARQGCRCISPDGDCSKPSRGVGVSGLGETGFKAMTDARPRGGGASACRCARSRGAMVVFGPSMGCTGSCAPRLV